MKPLRLWMVVVLILSFSLIVSAKEATAGKGFGVTKTQYIKKYNSWLSELGLRFEKYPLLSTKLKDVYSLNSDSSGVMLTLTGTSQLEKIMLIWATNTNLEEFNLVTTLCVIFAVEPDATTISKTSDLFHRKWKDKMDQGLNTFSFEMGDKLIDVEIKKGAGMSITITRP